MNEYLSMDQIRKSNEFKNYYLSKDTRIKNLGEEGVFKVKIIDGVRKYCKKDIENYMSELDLFWSKHIEIKEVLFNLFGLGNTVDNRSYCKKMLESKKILLISHKYIPSNKSNVYITKVDYCKILDEYEDVNDFFYKQENYSSLRHFKNLLTSNYSEHLLRLKKSLSHLYVKKDLIQFFKENKRKQINFDQVIEEIILIPEAQKELGISKNTIYQVFKDFNIKIYHIALKKSAILKKDFIFLKKKQEELIEKYSEEYYTYSQLKDIFINAGYSKVHESIKRVDSINMPNLLKGGFFRNASKMFSKNETEALIEELLYKKSVKELLASNNDDDQKFLEKALMITKIDYDKLITNQTRTLELWLNFINNKIVETNKKGKQKKYYIFQLAKLTNKIVDFIGEEELEKFHPNEIKLGLYNVADTKRYLYYFDSFIDKYNEVLISLAIDPIKKIEFKNGNEKKQEKELKIYEIDEYVEFKSYVKDLDLHKNKSIKIIEEIESGKRDSSNDYIDMWLFAIFHIENAFRPSTVVTLPQVEFDFLEYFEINNLEDLKQMTLNKEQCNFIKNIYKQQYYVHNKNRNEGPMVCSNGMTETFAWAILMITYKKRSLDLNTESLLNFHSQEGKPTSTIIKKFMKEFKIKDFKFNSYQFNRTVLTLINALTGLKKGEEVLDATAYLRAHLSSNTTKTYIKIPEKFLEEIMESLFDVGGFGYLYKKILDNSTGYNESKSNTLDDILDFRKDIQNIFGGIYDNEIKIQNLLNIDAYKSEIDNEFAIMSLNDINKIRKELKTGQLYSKQINYFCLFENCKLKLNNRCELCPFSIPTFYEINTILNRFFENYNSYKAANKMQPGETLKLLKKLMKDKENIQYFIEEYGFEIVEYLSKGMVGEVYFMMENKENTILKLEKEVLNIKVVGDLN